MIAEPIIPHPEEKKGYRNPKDAGSHDANERFVPGNEKPPCAKESEKTDMPYMLIIDESKKSHRSVEALFAPDFKVKSEPADSFDTSACMPPPDIIIYISTGSLRATRDRMEDVRKAWPTALTILLMPTLHNEQQLGDMIMPAHKVLFSPCSKARIVKEVESFRSILGHNVELREDNVLLSSLIEFTCSEIPQLYVCYNRVLPLLMTLCTRCGHDWRHVKKCFIYYLLIIARLDAEVLTEVINDHGPLIDSFKLKHLHTDRVVKLLETDTSTEAIATEIKYIQKYYDGVGFPKDDIEREDIPLTSRMIRLTLDHHYLLQRGKNAGEAVFSMHKHAGKYDPTLLELLAGIVADSGNRFTRPVYPLGLIPGMEIAEDVFGTVNGGKRKLLSQGEILTEKTIDYIQKQCSSILDVTEPIQIIEEIFIKED